MKCQRSTTTRQHWELLAAKNLKKRGKKWLFFFLAFSCWLLASAPAAFAQDLVTPACMADVRRELGKEQRRFRAHLLGEPLARDAPLQSVRFDRDGRSWMKVGQNAWKTLAPGVTSTRSDVGMDQQAEFEPLRGILEVKASSAYDLLPQTLQAFRALQCRTRAVCLAAQSPNISDPVSVQPLGCITIDVQRMNGCQIDRTADASTAESPTVVQTRIGQCDELRAALLDHEERVLKMLIAYDASYRTTLQFAGVFDDFLLAFRDPLLEPLLQAVRVMRAFDRQRCFNAQCDE